MNCCRFASLFLLWKCIALMVLARFDIKPDFHWCSLSTALGSRLQASHVSRIKHWPISTGSSVIKVLSSSYTLQLSKSASQYVDLLTIVSSFHFFTTGFSNLKNSWPRRKKAKKNLRLWFLPLNLTNLCLEHLDIEYLSATSWTLSPSGCKRFSSQSFTYKK